MEPKDLELLRASIGRRVVLHCTDGEDVIAEIHAVSDEDQDLIYDVISSNRPDRYGLSNESPAYLMHFIEISSVEPWQK